MFSALLLSLALIQGPPMGLVKSDTFDSGASLASQSIYAFIHDCEVTIDTALGGAYCVKTIGSPEAGGNFLVGQWIEGALGDPVYGGTTQHQGTTSLTPSGRLFRISACFDHTQLPWATVATFDGPGGLAIQARRTNQYQGQYSGIFALYHIAYDETQVSLRLFGNSGSGAPLIDEVFIPKDTNTSIAVEVLMSTITGGDERGGGTVTSDGYIHVYVDGALVIDHSGAEVGHYIDNQGPVAYWNSWANVTDPFTAVQFGPMGRLKNICIRDDALDCGFTCEAGDMVDGIPPITDTVPTCCDTDNTTAPGDTGTNPDPVGTLPPWIANCVDGGVVDAVADLADGEVW